MRAAGKGNAIRQISCYLYVCNLATNRSLIKSPSQQWIYLMGGKMHVAEFLVYMHSRI